MKIVFFGTPDYVVPILDGLYRYFRSNSNPSPISAVVTQEPKPAGRSKTLSFSAVDKWAYTKKVNKYFKATNIVEEKINADIGILASYGEIIPGFVISYFKYGILNIHPSLLPLWRGSSPIQASIISGEKETGVSIIKLDKKLDHGPIISQFKDEITAKDTGYSLREKLFQRSKEVMPKLIEAYLKGKITPKKQNEDIATYTRQLIKSDAFIDPKQLNLVLKGRKSKDIWKIPFIKNYTCDYSPTSLNNFIRALYSWPCAWTYIKTSENKSGSLKRLKILQSHLEENLLILDRVQLEGKSIVSWNQFLQGYPKASF